MNRLVSLVKNKYLLAFVVFFGWMLFFDRHDLTTQYSYYSQLKELENQKNFYETELEKIATGLHDLQHNSEALERIAREKYQMKKENEDVFILLPQE